MVTGWTAVFKESASKGRGGARSQLGGEVTGRSVLLEKIVLHQRFS